MTAEFSHWRRSRHSGPQGNCVEVGFAATAIGVRDTKDRDGGTLALTADQWTGFLHALKQDRYAHP